MRPRITPFNLSFLDIMFCGFGAVVLLVLILNRQTVQQRQETWKDLRSEVARLQRETVSEQQGLARSRAALTQADRELAESQGRARRMAAHLRRLRRELASYESQTLARRERVARLQADLKSLDRSNRRLGGQVQGEQGRGERVRAFSGDGQRQYLTGLKLGGKRVLILVDASASMLAETLVNVIRLRNMAPARRQRAAKWQRALAATEWLVANLPAAAKYQLFTFDTRAGPVLPKSAGRWLEAADRETLDRAIDAVRHRVPGGGTSLERAFEAVAGMSPRPDTILLITDGLPTQGKTRPARNKVSAEERLRLFQQAVKALPAGIPVNTILLPMEGDPYAAFAFWKLAVDTRGAFLTPSRDWP